MLDAPPDLHRIRGRLLHQLRENSFPGRKVAIWPEARPDDEMLIEIFEHWLERP